MLPHLNVVRWSLDELRGHGGNDLLAVLDACDEPTVAPKVAELGNHGASLYSGNAAVRFSNFAPYLVRVRSDLLIWIEETLWGKPWGIFLLSRQDLLDVRTHLRRFLLVKLPDNQQVYFRFYDPRVLPTFLRSCTEAEVAAFFGPIDHFICQEEDGEGLLVFAPQ